MGRKVARTLGRKISKLHLSNFADGDIRVWVEEKVKGKDCVVLQTTRLNPNNRLMELCLVVSALKTAGAKSVLAVIPCLGYSRQFKTYQQGETNTAALVAQFLEVSGVGKVIFVNLHTEKILKFFKIQAINLKTDELFAEEIKKLRLKNFVLVAPDKGSMEYVTGVARKLEIPLVWIKKRRKSKGFGKEDWCEALALSGEVRSQDVVIVDDEISSGGTVVKAVELLKKNGAGKIYVFATHPVFSEKTFEILPKGSLEKIVVTDTISLEKRAFKKIHNLKVISVADLLAKEIKRHF